MSAAWILQVVQMVATVLPDLLRKHGEGNEVAALQELVATYQKTRAGTIPDRGDEIADNRAEVDAKLEARSKGD